MRRGRKKFSTKSTLRVRANHEIRIPRIFLIDETGKKVGEMETREALSMAQERGYDLVEISPNAKPPIVKFLDYGKYKYDLSQKDRQKRKQQKEIEIKEVRMSLKTGEHDLEVKRKKALKFLKEGRQVKVTLRFRGREIVHAELGKEILTNFFDKLTDVAELEKPAVKLGKMLSIIIKPKK